MVPKGRELDGNNQGVRSWRTEEIGGCQRGLGVTKWVIKSKSTHFQFIKTLSQVDIMYNMTVVNNTVLHI